MIVENESYAFQASLLKYLHKNCLFVSTITLCLLAQAISPGSWEKVEAHSDRGTSGCNNLRLRSCSGAVGLKIVLIKVGKFADIIAVSGYLSMSNISAMEEMLAFWCTWWM